MRLKKILIIVPSFVIGGSERVQYLFASELEKITNYKITVFFLSKRNLNNLTFWSELNFSKIIYANSVREKYGMFYLLKHLVTSKYDLIFTSNSHLNGFVSLLKILRIIRNCKVVIRESNDVYNRFKNKKILWLYAFYHKLYYGSNKIIFQNEKMLQRFLISNKFAKNKSVIIKNPVEIKTNISQYTPNSLSLVMVGRLNKNKNHILGLKLIKQLKKKYKNIKLDIYGSGPLKTYLNNYIENNELKSNVKIISKYHSVNEIFLKKYSIFLHLSYYEGFPNVILEACNYMVPCIISTDCAGGLSKIKNIILVKNDINNLNLKVEMQLNKNLSFALDYKKYVINNHNSKSFTSKILK